MHKITTFKSSKQDDPKKSNSKESSPIKKGSPIKSSPEKNNLKKTESKKEPKDAFRKQACFYSSLNGEDPEEKLKNRPKGTYLLYEKESKIVFAYVNCDREISHCKIEDFISFPSPTAVIKILNQKYENLIFEPLNRTPIQIEKNQKQNEDKKEFNTSSQKKPFSPFRVYSA